MIGSKKTIHTLNSYQPNALTLLHTQNLDNLKAGAAHQHQPVELFYFNAAIAAS
jgi:hypothetical protein